MMSTVLCCEEDKYLALSSVAFQSLLLYNSVRGHWGFNDCLHEIFKWKFLLLNLASYQFVSKFTYDLGRNMTLRVCKRMCQTWNEL